MVTNSEMIPPPDDKAMPIPCPDGSPDEASRDRGIISRLEKLSVAAVSDSLDRVGLRTNVMAPRIRPLYETARMVGRAVTVLLVEVQSPPADPRDAYRGEIEAVDALHPGDVMVVSTCAGSYWGELLATATRSRGGVGVIADAYTRDTAKLIEMQFPTFVSGISAQDSLGRTDVRAHGLPVECGGVVVHPGDLLIADRDGVAVIPTRAAGQVVEMAENKMRTEHDMRSKLESGMSLSQAFALYEIL